MKKHLVVLLVIASFALLGFRTCTPAQCPDIDKLPLSQDVSVIGDSILAFNVDKCNDIASQLSRKLGEKVPRMAMGGARMSCDAPTAHCAGVPDIPIQYFEKLKAVQPVPKVVVMDGGGNDIQFECSAAELPLCTEDINKVVEELREFLTTVKGEQKQVIYVGYYYPINRDLQKFRSALEIAIAKTQQLCQELGVVYIDTRPYFKTPDMYFLLDGTHPSEKGSTVITDLVYKEITKMTYLKTTMEEETAEMNIFQKLFAWFMSLLNSILGKG